MNLKPRRHEEPEINMVSSDRRGADDGDLFHADRELQRRGAAAIRLPQSARRPGAQAPGTGGDVTAGGSYLVNNRELVNASPDTLRAAIVKVARRARDSR